MDASTPQDYLVSMSATTSPAKGHQPPSATATIIKFSTSEQPSPASLLRLLLLMAGIESNPGPSTPGNIWLCAICKLPIHPNSTSVQCNKCKQWCHLRVCTSLQSHRQWTTSFIGSCCQSMSTIHNTPPQQSLTNANLKILQYNCNGLTNKIDEILHYMTQNNIQIGAIQETKLNPSSKFPNTHGHFSIIRHDRPNSERGGGLAFIIHDSILYKTFMLPPSLPDEVIEQQCISVHSGTTELKIINVYIPPISSCPSGYRASISHLLNSDDTIIVGDFNGHHNTWDSYLSSDRRGEDLAAEIEQSDFGILNDEQQYTRLVGDQISSPDISLASTSLLQTTDWNANIKLSSDHLPITISILRTIQKIKSENKTFINFVKANWDGFLEYTESRFEREPLPTNVIKGEKVFSNILNKGRKLHVPTGRIPNIIPNFPTEAINLAEERDIIRQANPNDPKIKILNKQIAETVREHKKNKWLKHLKEATFNRGAKNLWKTTKNLMNSNITSPKNNTIHFNQIPTPDAKTCANQFNKQFTAYANNKGKARRQTNRKFKVKETNETVEQEIKSDDVTNTIKKTKNSKALGPDNISPLMLKHIGQKGTEFLTKLLNLSLQTLTIPNSWKTARIIPILKPGKNPDQGLSYRPISLLSPVAKLLESLLLPLLTEDITLANHQHGFRKNHGTTTALHVIEDQVTNGFNQRRPCQRTILVALDLSKAFDTVDHVVLLNDILDTNITLRIKRWLFNYIKGRQTYVEFRNAKSKFRPLKQGVAQGGVISPLLFNLYLSKMPLPPPGITLVTYADDCSILASGNDIDELTILINNYLVTMHSWFTNRNLQLSPEKSSATLFTTWTCEMNTELKIKINEQQLPTVKTPKILGVTFDPMLTFKAHTDNIAKKLRSRNNMFKSLAGTTWGKEKETMVTAFKALSRPLLTYAAPVWSTHLSDSQWKKLQVCQNTALRITTGCVLMSNIDHLHNETLILPVKPHNLMMSEQYLLSSHVEGHPSNSLVTKPRPPRNIKRSMMSLKPNINCFLPYPTIDKEHLKICNGEIHTKTVEDTIQNFKPNKVLNEAPPPIAKEEKELPRKTRARLAQLRSGWSPMLNHYMHRLDPNIQDKCNQCNTGPHDVHHLFHCPAHPTTLTVRDLWDKPKDVALFLDLDLREEHTVEI
ncbi:hypothetical protein M8J77_001119 [Diaphorina citri]|nr:hypothetical protein M8J77_001119 [Diaphorina citri]